MESGFELPEKQGQEGGKSAMARVTKVLSKAGSVFWKVLELVLVVKMGHELIKKKRESNPAHQGSLIFAAIQANKQKGYSQEKILEYLERATDRQKPASERKYADSPGFPFTKNELVKLIASISDDQAKLEEMLCLLEEMDEEEFILMMNLLRHDVLGQLLRVHGQELIDKIKTARDEVSKSIASTYAALGPSQRLEELDQRIGAGIRSLREELTIPLRERARQRKNTTLWKQLTRRRIRNAGEIERMVAAI